MSRSMTVRLLALCIVLCGSAKSPGQDGTWPQYQGKRRDNISDETGLLKTWPEDGPKLLWSVSGCGKGYSTAAVTDKMLYTAGAFSNGTFVLAFNLDGTPAWRKPNGTSWKAAKHMRWARRYDGARATPTVDGDVVYHLGDMGVLTAFDAGTGATVWSIDVTKTFDAERPNYGYTESVLIDGDNLICCPAGAKGYIVALNKKNGSTVWANADIKEGAGFASPILVDHGGMRQIVTLSERGVFGVEASTGKSLWRQPFTNKRKNNIPTPRHHDGFIFASTGYGAGSTLIELSVDKGAVTSSVVWKNEYLDSMYGGFVLVDGHVYGAAYEKPAWVCLDFKTGDLRYRAESDVTGSATYADGMLYCLSHTGTMSLVPCTPREYKPVSRFTVPPGGEGKFWTCPVVCGGRLYIRHLGRLHVYDVKGR